jgi:anaerobic magnesium-protoporphyrin IX monomethyl ester cyclase
MSPPRERLRVLFLHPKTLVDSWPFSHDTLGEVVKVPSLVYPLLAATIEHLPVAIEIFDGYVQPESFRRYKQRLARADVIAITVMTPLKALDTEMTLRLIRRINPDAAIVLGGNHATAFPERWIERGADYVITREGEQAFPALIRHLLGDGPLERVPNLVHRGGATGPSPALVSLDDTPIPSWHRMDLRYYRPRIGPHGHAATIEVSRGCVFRCEFCNINKFWQYQQRYKSVDRVLEEFDRLHALGVRQVFFADDNFGFDYDHTCQLFEALIRRDRGFRLGAFIRGDTVHKHPEFARLASRAGLRLALMGIETLDRDQLRAYRKGVAARDVTAMWTGVYQQLRSHGIFVLGLFLNALDPTDAAQAGRAGAGADGRVCDFHYSSDLIPQKNSALYDQMQMQAQMQATMRSGPAGLGQQATTRPFKLKDMFYHDWNLPSVEFDHGAQRNWKKLSASAKGLQPFFLAGFVSPRRLRRHFAWSHSLLIAERLLTGSREDIWRYRIAKDDSLPLEGRQQMILDSVLTDRYLDRLVTGQTWVGPLAIRHALARVRDGLVQWTPRALRP